jgi:hypothetical protein
LFKILHYFEQIAMENFSEATVGYRQNKEAAEKWVQLFNTPYFNVTSVSVAYPFLMTNKIEVDILVSKCLRRCHYSPLMYQNFINIVQYLRNFVDQTEKHKTHWMTKLTENTFEDQTD